MNSKMSSIRSVLIPLIVQMMNVMSYHALDVLSIISLKMSVVNNLLSIIFLVVLIFLKDSLAQIVQSLSMKLADKNEEIPGSMMTANPYKMK